MSSRSHRKRQTRLTFTPLPSSSPAASSYHDQIRSRAAAVGYDGSPNSTKRRKLRDVSSLKPSIYENSDGLEEQAGMPTPEPSLQSRTAGTHSVKVSGDVVSESDSDSEPIRSSQFKPSAKKQAGHSKIDVATKNSLNDIPSSSNDMFRPSKSTATKGGIFSSQKMRSSGHVSMGGDSDGMPSSPPQLTLQNNESRRASKRSTRSNASKTKPDLSRLPSSKKASNLLVELGDESNEESEPDLPVVPNARRYKGLQQDGNGSVSSPLDLDDSESDIVSSSRPRRLKARSQSSAATTNGDQRDIDETNEEGGVTKNDTKRGRLLSREEQQELESDILDLQSSDQDLPPRERRLDTQSAKKVARNEALEQLKRRRAGSRPTPKVITIDSDSSASESDPGYLSTEQSDEEIGVKPFEANEEDEDFIIDDGDDTLGAPSGLPLEFSRYASMGTKDLFKFAIDWMVQKKLNPAFESKDDLYRLTFQKLDDEVQGLAGSKFKSAAWTQEFIFALRARPVIDYSPIDRGSAEHFMRDRCDACNRSGHPATWAIQFSGRPYHRNNLEPVPSSDDSDSESGSDDDNDGSARDDKGRVIAGSAMIFYVGKTCMANAETAHKLEHWRYELYGWVVDWLEEQGHMTDAKIVQRDRWSERKRWKYANKVSDKMVNEGIVDDLWKDFRSNVKKAQEAKRDRWDA